MKIILLLFICLSLLTACAPGAQHISLSVATLTPQGDLQRQVSTLVADAIRATSAAMATATPAPSSSPSQAPSQALYTSQALGIRFQYPETWHVQESQPPPTVTLTSFDPAHPPHKLEWTDQTARLQLRLLPAGSVPAGLDAWLESARQSARSNQLDITSEERFYIQGQPAALLSLVSGSGGIIFQILTVQQGRYYEALVEGNLALGKAVLGTLQADAPAEIRPPDSDTPAAGICSDPQEDPVTILIGVGPDGLPKAGRCIRIAPAQRIRFVNQSNALFVFSLPGLDIDLPAGGETTLPEPSGMYFAPGVHLLPGGPELWIRVP